MPDETDLWQLKIAGISIFSAFSQTEAYDVKEACIRLSRIWDNVDSKTLKGAFSIWKWQRNYVSAAILVWYFNTQYESLLLGMRLYYSPTCDYSDLVAETILLDLLSSPEKTKPW